MENPHVERRLDRLDEIAVAGHIEVIAHPLFLEHVSVVVDIDAIVHDGVVMRPSEVPGQPHHECPAGHRLIDFDGVSPCRLRGMERDLVNGVAKSPGNVNIVPANTITHDCRPIRGNRYQMLVAGPPGPLCLHLAALLHRELDGLHELHAVLLARNIADALNEDAIAPAGRARYRNHAVGQQRYHAHADGTGNNAFDEVAAGNTAAFGSRSGIPCHLGLAFISRFSRHRNPSVSLDGPPLSFPQAHNMNTFIFFI